jgi:multidrug efflux pump subunit AcrB
MWIVRLALRRPYSVAVVALLIFIFGFMSIVSMQTDIFPVIDIPVVGVVWSYPGLSAIDMERRVTILTERAISTTVNGVSRIESQSIAGIGLLRIYFQPGTDIGASIAQMAAVCSTVLRSMPPGMTPPVILQFNASNLPIAQITLASQTLPEQQLFDWGLNFLRVRLFTIPGLSIPAPYGGLSRQINVDVDPNRLLSRGLSPMDVVNALQASNLILPAGSARIGNLEYNVALNSSPTKVSQFNDVPVRVVGDQLVTLGDVAKVEDAFADQTNIVRVNGHRSTYVNILKKANASTLTVLNAVKAMLPEMQGIAPKGLNLALDFDQSVFVKGAIDSVLHEAVISSILVSLMILLFLGSWRSVIVVCTSIPLAILVSVIGLNLTGNTINIMTLGGLSLAIGMLVDDATVTVENIHRNRVLGLPLTRAILVGAEQIALPAIMATLSICIVFFPVVLLTGPSRFLFVPMALSVVFAMMASYVLSRTLVPLLCRMLLVKEEVHEDEAKSSMFPKFVRFFHSVQERYDRILQVLMENRKAVLIACGVLTLVTLSLPFVAGRDFFPQTDTGLMKLHFRAPTGTRIENTEEMVAAAEKRIREIIPDDELSTINSMIGLPISYNLAFVPTDNIGGMDAEILVALKPDHSPTVKYQKKIRDQLKLDFPGASVYFQPADIVNQVLNFGLSSPIDVQIEGSDFNKSFGYAQTLRQKLAQIPGLVDLNVKQVFDFPTLAVKVDRLRAARLGLSQRDVANSMITTLSSSALVAPSFFLNPQNGVNYTVAVKVPLRKMTSVEQLFSTPITPTTSPLIQAGGLAAPTALPTSAAQRLGNLMTYTAESEPASIYHSNVQRVLNLTASVESRDLGGVISDIQTAIKGLGDLPTGTKITIRGQGEVMSEAFFKLGVGLILAMILVYLLMVVLFQSWMDPFIVMIAVPGALIGILWMLVLTGTTINVESFMGSIMAVGIAASNAILLVSFANEVRVEKNLEALPAALEAGKSRLRPVLMTALAMVIGMIPAALALGEGGEQNAPLGRAVIGGLIVATMVTLFIVPIVYSLLRTGVPTKHLLDEKLAKEEMEGPNVQQH